MSYRLVAVLFIFSCLFACKREEHDFLYRITDSIDLEMYGYADAQGRIVIPPGKYPMCYTDTLKTFAIVMIAQKGFVAIDRNENELFEVFPFDNGPDEPSEGLFRIVKGDKIGFANLEGEIVISPQYECAHPFKNGKARVGLHCAQKQDGEHFYWESDDWFHIDLHGKRTEQQ